MERSALDKIADERTLLLPLVSAQFETPMLGTIARERGRFRFDIKAISNSKEIYCCSFKVFSSDGC